MIIPMNSQKHETQIAFDWAVEKGVFSDDPDAYNYTGNWMYLGESDKGLSFRNLDSGCVAHLTKRGNVCLANHV